MFTVTLAFLIFSTSNLDNIEFLITAVFRELVGADISVLKFSSFVRIDPHWKYTDNAQDTLDEPALWKVLMQL